MDEGVRVWWSRASDDPGLIDLLDDRERSRAARRDDPALYVSAHALLRTAVARTTGGDPRSVAFERTCVTCGEHTHGKPAVAGQDGLFVSLSYAGGLALAAVTRAGHVGVDVEEVREAAFEGFNSVTLAPDEVAAMDALPASEVAAARARVWARKEAVLKATGDGLVVDPREVVVSGPAEEAALRAWRARAQLPGPVALVDLALARPGYAAAVAVLAEGPVRVELVSPA